MRKLLSIFFIIILLPTCLIADCSVNTDSTGCVSYDGCFFVPATGMLDPECRPCESGTYNSDSLETTDYCTTCPTSYGVSGKLPNPDAYDNGQAECPWMCDANYYKSGNACEICPTGATSPAGSDDVNDCICPTGTHLAYNNGTYSCEQCSCTPPENGSCTTTYNETTGCQTTITCDVGYYKTETSGTVLCTACPAGTTTGTAGATAKSACHMTQNTKFCDANGENCMKLLPAGITINQ